MSVFKDEEEDEEPGIKISEAAEKVHLNNSGLNFLFFLWISVVWQLEVQLV
jgi:hypothetical protein